MKGRFSLSGSRPRSKLSSKRGSAKSKRFTPSRSMSLTATTSSSPQLTPLSPPRISAPTSPDLRRAVSMFPPITSPRSPTTPRSPSLKSPKSSKSTPTYMLPTRRKSTLGRPVKDRILPKVGPNLKQMVKNTESRRVFLGRKDKIIKLVAEDGAEFKISRRWACISSYIKKACEDDKVSTVTITKVDEESLERICEYMENRKGDDFIKVSKTLKVTMLDNVGKDFAWCAKWIDLRARHRPKFYKLIAAANHMGISGLVSLGVTKIATLLKYCRTEDIDRVLDPHITDGQLRQLRKFVVVNGKSKEKSYNSGT